VTEVAEHTRWPIVFAAIAAGIAVAFQVGKMPAALPLLRADLGLSAVEAGWAISIFNGVTCVLGLAAGALSDALGARRLILGGLILTAAASIAGGFAESGAMLLATRLAEGLGALTVFVSAPVVILRAVTVRDMRFAFGLWSAYMPTGHSLLVLVSPLLLALADWRGLWWIVALLLLSCAAGFAALSRPIADPPFRGAPALARLRGDATAVVQSRGPWLLAFCFLTYTANFLALVSFLPTFLVEGGHMALGPAAVVTAIVIFGNALGNVLGGWLLQRGAPRWLLIAAASLIMGITAVLVYADAIPDASRIALALAFSFFGGLLPASVLGGVPVHSPSPALVASTSGLILQCTNLGMLLAPPAFAALAAGYGWSTAPLMIAASAAAGVACAIWLGRHERHKAAFSRDRRPRPDAPAPESAPHGRNWGA
jgi:predicted MFS family arabinose efflux permease